MRHHHNRVQSGASHFRRRRGMGGLAPKAELGRDHGERAFLGGDVRRAGVPAQNRIDVPKRTRAQHVELPVAAFFGRRAVKADGALGLVIGHPVLHGNRGEQSGGAQQVVPAAVTRASRNQGLALGNRILRQPGERIVFSEDGDDGLPLPPFGCERGRDSGDVVGNPEAGGPKLGLEELGAALLVVTRVPRGPRSSARPLCNGRPVGPYSEECDRDRPRSHSRRRPQSAASR